MDVSKNALIMCCTKENNLSIISIRNRNNEEVTDYDNVKRSDCRR